MTNEENKTAVELNEDSLDSVAGGAQGAAPGGSKEEVITCPYHYKECLCITWDQPVTICGKGSCTRGTIHHKCVSCGRDFYTHPGDNSWYALDGCKIVSE